MAHKEFPEEYKEDTLAPKTEENAVNPQADAHPIRGSQDTLQGYFNTQRNSSSHLPLAITSPDVEHVTKIRLNVVKYL